MTYLSDAAGVELLGAATTLAVREGNGEKSSTGAKTLATCGRTGSTRSRPAAQ